MTMDKNHTLAMLLDFDGGTDYGTGRYQRLTARPVHYVDTMGETDHVLSIGDYDSDHGALADLMVYAQQSANDGRSYGFSVTYDRPHNVTLHRSKLMTAKLSAIARKLDKIASTYGPAVTYAQFVLRVADAIGCTKFLAPRSDTMLPSGRFHRVMNAESAAYAIDKAERDFTAKYGTKDAESA
jgi:hypothetical protein